MSIEAMLISQAGESLKDFFALYLCVDNVNIKILSLIVENSLLWDGHPCLFYFFYTASKFENATSPVKGKIGNVNHLKINQLTKDKQGSYF